MTVLINAPNRIESIGVPGITHTDTTSCHDSVVDFLVEHGMANWHGYRYWEVMSSYSYEDGTGIPEDQYLSCSNDKITWVHAPIFKLTTGFPAVNTLFWTGTITLGSHEIFDGSSLPGAESGMIAELVGEMAYGDVGTIDFEASSAGWTGTANLYTRTPGQNFSDSSMVYDPDRDALLLHYNREGTDPATVQVILSFSGSTFVKGAEVGLTFGGVTEGNIMAPAFIRLSATDYRMYAISALTGNSFVYAISSNGLDFSTPVDIGDPLSAKYGQRPWHQHAKKSTVIANQIDFVVSGKTDGHNMDYMYLYYAHAWLDNPTNIVAPLAQALLGPTGVGNAATHHWDSEGIYVADLVMEADGSNYKMNCWYTGTSYGLPYSSAWGARHANCGSTGFTSGVIGTIAELTLAVGFRQVVTNAAPSMVVPSLTGIRQGCFGQLVSNATPTMSIPALAGIEQGYFEQVITRPEPIYCIPVLIGVLNNTLIRAPNGPVKILDSAGNNITIIYA
jgi:hypothetical protein